MTSTPLRSLLALVAMLCAAFASAGTITVTSPKNNDYLGLSNTITFNLSGASVQVKVTATATSPTGTVTSISTNVTPNADGTGSGSIELNFNEGATEGVYTIVVSAVETANNTYAPVTLTETVDVEAPRFTELTPVDGGYTRGLIKIRAAVDEPNVDTWTVRVGNQTIATGDGAVISADYDATRLQNDGAQSIAITVKDKANNSVTKNITVTLDRQKPTVQIVYPTSGSRISTGQDVTVVVDVTDASTTSLDRTGIDVIAKKTDGTFIARVTFVSLRGTTGATQRWTGRIRYKKGLLPSQFKLTASAIDRAGNAANLQEVTVRYGR